MKKDLLQTRVKPISLDTFIPMPLIDTTEKMACQARDTVRAARIYVLAAPLS